MYPTPTPLQYVIIFYLYMSFSPGRNTLSNLCDVYCLSFVGHCPHVILVGCMILQEDNDLGNHWHTNNSWLHWENPNNSQMRLEMDCWVWTSGLRSKNRYVLGFFSVFLFFHCNMVLGVLGPFPVCLGKINALKLQKVPTHSIIGFLSPLWAKMQVKKNETKPSALSSLYNIITYMLSRRNIEAGPTTATPTAVPSCSPKLCWYLF